MSWCALEISIQDYEKDNHLMITCWKLCKKAPINNIFCFLTTLNKKAHEQMIDNDFGICNHILGQIWDLSNWVNFK